MVQSILRLGLASAVALTPLLTCGTAADAKPSVMVETISVGTWCDALINISATHAEGGLAKSKPLAGNVIDAAYAYQFGPVAFKPTWGKGDETFRDTRRGALSYFVGGRSRF